jgi:hypothetical protein
MIQSNKDAAHEMDVIVVGLLCGIGFVGLREKMPA